MLEYPGLTSHTFKELIAKLFGAGAVDHSKLLCETICKTQMLLE